MHAPQPAGLSPPPALPEAPAAKELPVLLPTVVPPDNVPDVAGSVTAAEDPEFPADVAAEDGPFAEDDAGAAELLLPMPASKGTPPSACGGSVNQPTTASRASNWEPVLR